MSNNSTLQTTDSDCRTKGNPPTIKMECARRWTADWRNAHPNDARAFLIPVKDLLKAMKEMDIIRKNNDGTYSIVDAVNTGIRAYMAIDDQGKQKLLIVGTFLEVDDQTHYDIVEGRKIPLSDEVTPYESGVFDFTTPCPSECDDDSPLNL